jgi:spectinomycin phosphotransferase
VLLAALSEGWGFDARSFEYAPVGGGSYHWTATDAEGARFFVTADDLDTKPWLGDTTDSAFEGLRRAFDTAFVLRRRGLAFVAAPVPATGGETVRRVGARYSIALFPFVPGRAGEYGNYDPETRAAVVSLLAELHRATPAAESTARTIELEVPGRPRLEAALREVNETWSNGPFSEPARHALECHSADLADLFALHDRLSEQVRSRGGHWVITHGEPHAANVMRTSGGHVLVDWDTVALAPPERDLWILAGDSADRAATSYADATGRLLDRAALDFFRLTWDLADIAAFTDALRAPHRRDADTAKAYDALAELLATRDRWAALL